MYKLNAKPLTLRKFEKNDHDYLGNVEVENAVWPDYPSTVEDLKKSDAERDPELVFEWVLAEIGGKIVAYGGYGQPVFSQQPDKFFINVTVHPDHRRQGVGTAIYDHITDCLRKHQVSVLVASTSDDQPDAPGFLARRGFKIVQRQVVLHLDVQSFDNERTQVIKSDNIMISALCDLMPKASDWKRRCWELDWEIEQDIPTSEPPMHFTLEQYSRRFENPKFKPESWFIAHQGDEWIGMSTLSTDPATPGKFYTHITGVRRSFRRQGIAMAMKLRGIEYVKNHGGTLIETDCEENNPMLDLNLALGFKPKYADLDFQKTL